MPIHLLKSLRKIPWQLYTTVLRNIQFLAAKLFEVKNELLPPFMNETFTKNTQFYYHLLGPYFYTFGLNTERYSVSHHIQSKCGKIRARRTPSMDTFHAVYDLGKKLNFREIMLKWCKTEVKL